MIVVTAFLFYEPDKVPGRFKDLNDDHQRMLDVLKASSEVKWIAILPPHFTGTLYFIFTGYDKKRGHCERETWKGEVTR
jgi:hypothetical protein